MYAFNVNVLARTSSKLLDDAVKLCVTHCSYVEWNLRVTSSVAIHMMRK